MLNSACLCLVFLVGVRSDIQGHIVGGEYQNIEDNPHAVPLNMNCFDGGSKASYICAASILNQAILLTAAHCIQCLDMDIAVSIGHRHITQGLIIKVASKKYHPDFNVRDMSNDIALLKMVKRIPLGRMSKRVAVMKTPPFAGFGIIAGWGMIDEKNQLMSPYLKRITQKLWPQDKCCELYKKLLPEGALCASFDNDKQYPSRGDSGAGLIIYGYIAIGLVSFKISNIGNHIIIYTNVSFHYDWLVQTSRKMYCA